MTAIFKRTILICYLICGFLTPEVLKAEKRHPFHLSSTEVEYNPKSLTLEISCRIFTDDFETALAKGNKVKVDLSAESKHKAMEEMVKKYILSNIAVKGNAKNLALSYVGFERDNEAIVVYLETEPVKALRKLETTNTVLYDLFDDQSNIIHFTVNGNRKSAKLDYPNRKLVTDF